MVQNLERERERLIKNVQYAFCVFTIGAGFLIAGFVLLDRFSTQEKECEAKLKSYDFVCFNASNQVIENSGVGTVKAYQNVSLKNREVKMYYSFGQEIDSSKENIKNINDWFADSTGGFYCCSPDLITAYQNCVCEVKTSNELASTLILLGFVMIVLIFPAFMNEIQN